MKYSDSPGRNAEFDFKQIPLDLAKKMTFRFDNPLFCHCFLLIPTSRCNLNCKYCFSHAEKQYQTDDMDPALAVSFLHDVLHWQEKNGIKWPLRQINFTGGEPTLHPDLILEVVRYLKTTPVSYLPFVRTNGVIQDDTLEKLLQEDLMFQISFDGRNGDLRYGEQKSDMTAHVIETIERITERGMPILLRPTISAKNMSEMDDILDFAIEHKLAGVFMSPVDNQVGNAEKYDVTRPILSEFMSNFEKILKKAIEHNIHIFSCEHIRVATEGKQIETAHCIFLPDGSIMRTRPYASPNIPEAKENIVAKYTMQDGFSFDYEKISKKIINFVNNQKRLCAGCSVEGLCTGRNQNNTMLMNDPNLQKLDDYNCEITRGFTELLQKYKTPMPFQIKNFVEKLNSRT